MRCRPSPAETIETYPSVHVYPLHVAAKGGHLSVLATLLAKQTSRKLWRMATLHCLRRHGRVTCLWWQHSWRHKQTPTKPTLSMEPAHFPSSACTLFLLSFSYIHTHTNTHTCARAQHTRARTLLDVVCAYELSFCLRSWSFAFFLRAPVAQW